MKLVAILGGTRLPFCRMGTQYKNLSALTLMTDCLAGLVKQYNLQGKKLGDVALGAVMNHPKDWNYARDAVLQSGLSRETPALNIQRACATSLETTAWVAHRIAQGEIECGIAGGSDAMSYAPLTFPHSFAQKMLSLKRARSLWNRVKALSHFRPKDFKPLLPSVTEASTGKTMGQHCELMAQTWQLTQEEQDQFALHSHQKADLAYQNGFYDDLVMPYLGLTRDNTVRADSTLEKLSKLKPVFAKNGTLTAGNSSPLTDGASCTLLSSLEWAEEHNLPVLAILEGIQTGAIDFEQEGLLMAPAYAVSELLKNHDLQLQDFDFYEIHEAFAAQALCTLKAWEDPIFCKTRLNREKPLGKIDPAKLNVTGGSVALGHPFGATGTRLISTLAKHIHTKGSARGLISICTGGGMGTAAILKAI